MVNQYLLVVKKPITSILKWWRNVRELFRTAYVNEIQKQLTLRNQVGCEGLEPPTR